MLKTQRPLKVTGQFNFNVIDNKIEQQVYSDSFEGYESFGSAKHC